MVAEETGRTNFDKVKGPWINHTCCAVHCNSCCAVQCNCECVPTEFVRDRKEGCFSVNVRTRRDVKATGGQPVEFLADYGEDYLMNLGSKCVCAQACPASLKRAL